MVANPAFCRLLWKVLIIFTNIGKSYILITEKEVLVFEKMGNGVF